jgi:hypothetical protein
LARRVLFLVKPKIKGFTKSKSGLRFTESRDGPRFKGKVCVFIKSRNSLRFAESRGSLRFEGKVITCL